MEKITVFVEVSKKKTFATAMDWPGWSRSGKDEALALAALLDYGSRYAHIIQGTGIEYQAPKDISDLEVIQRQEGNATTAFGAPAVIADFDRLPIDEKELLRFQSILRASWQALDATVQQAEGKELSKGPRGGGRDLEKILGHVLEADYAYLRKIASKRKPDPEQSLLEEIVETRKVIQAALDTAVKEGLPEKGPRGGLIWPARFFVRRVVWHTIDHAWEIEDRIV